MKYLKLYLKDKIGKIILFLMVMAVSVLILEIYSISTDIILYIVEVDVTICAIFEIYEFYMFVKKMRLLEKYNSMENVYEINELQPVGIVEEQYCNLTDKLLRQSIDTVTDKEKSMKEMQDYYAVWAHQIKTPIAASNLLIQTMESDEQKIKELKIEMFKIEFYVDAVMNFLKLGDITSDYVFKKYDMGNMVNKSVKKFASQFITKKISISISDINKEIYTDEKWFCYIIEQILSNSVKYTGKNGKVSIYITENTEKDSVTLVIEDNGIGISKEDIPRIMEKGFTGFNGRMNKKSTGIGLYLCNSAAKKLGIQIEIESEVGKGTKVMLILNQEHKIHE